MSHTDKKTLNQLKKQIQKHDYYYYVLDQPLISDYEYDQLFQQLKNLEKKYPQWMDKNSPSQRVPGKPLNVFEKGSHYKAMLSLDNTYSVKECLLFIQKVKKSLKKEKVRFFCEPKLDGVAVNLIYQDGELVCALTRGDGLIGENVLENVKTIKSIPLELPTKKIPSLIEVRGEIVIFKKDLVLINQRQEKKSEKLYSNPRNMAAGTLRNLDPKVASSRKLRVFFHSFGEIQSDSIAHQSDFFDWLKKMNFPVLSYSLWMKDFVKQQSQYLQKPLCLLSDQEEEIVSYYKYLESIRNDLPFETDGLVIKVNSLKEQMALGFTQRSPKWACALKFCPEWSMTQITDIFVQIGRTGIVTPVAQMKEVKIGNVKVSQATLHNMSEISKKDVRIGDFVRIQRAGDVIPEVIDVFKQRRPKDTKIFQMPKNCPSCKQILTSIDEGIYCMNLQCSAVILRRLQHFCSKKAMNIETLGDQILNKLFQKKWIKNFSDIYFLTQEKLRTLDGFADQSAKNVIQNIERSKKTSFARFLFALGIRHVGWVTATKISEFLGGDRVAFEKLMKLSAEDLLPVSDIGQVVAESLVLNLSRLSEEINQLLDVVGIELIVPKKDSKKLDGMLFVITGAFAQSRKEIEQTIARHGGKYSSSVSQKTTYLLCGQDAGSKKQKAIQLNIVILDWDQFQKLLN